MQMPLPVTENLKDEKLIDSNFLGHIVPKNSNKPLWIPKENKIAKNLASVHLKQLINVMP